MDASVWIKLNLPPEASFAKNGVSLTVDEAVSAVLDQFASYSTEVSKRYALAELIDMWLSQFKADREKEGEYERSGVLKMWRDRRNQLVEEAQDLDDAKLNFVPLKFRKRNCSDENSRCL